MTHLDRLNKALAKIGHARSSIIRTAAEWQAAGVETSPLTEPLVEIQEALAQLEALSGNLSDSPTASPRPRPSAFAAPAGPNTAAEPTT